MTTRVCLMGLLVGALTGPAADVPPSKNRDVVLSASRALVGVDQLCVVLAIRGADGDTRFVDSLTLKAHVVDKLSTAGIKLVESATDLVPRLIVRIEDTPVPESDKLLCRVQVSLIRQVLLSGQPNLPLEAEVWQGTPATALVAKASGTETMWSVVAGRLETFIDSYQAAVGLPALPSVAKPEHAAPTASEYAFISSKNSPVFHRPQCRWAQNIASDNRVGYKSREEALQAGKRPCKICKP